MQKDPALESLLLPFAKGDLTWPSGPVLFLRARDGWALRQQSLGRLHCEQSFKPWADELSSAGLQVHASAETQHGYALVLVLPPRQRDEARALFAHALSMAAPGGVVLASIANDEGAKSGEADLQKLTELGGKLTKNHCRVFWTKPLNGSHDAALLTQWQRLDAPRKILDGRYTSRPGVFAWDRIDPASSLLVEHLPSDLRGVGADLGAGWGYLAQAVLARNPEVQAMHLFEAEARALDCARENLSGFAAAQFHWHDVTAGVPGQYDFIVMNPPFHTTHRAGRPDIGQRFISVAAKALKPGGRLWMVANRHLPYEHTLGDNFGKLRLVDERDGFKLVEAVKAR